MPLESSKNGGTEKTWLQLSLLNRLELVPKKDVHKGAVTLSCSGAGGLWDQKSLSSPCSAVKPMPEEHALAHAWSCL